MTTSVVAEKAIDKVPQPFMIKKKKTLWKVSLDKTYLNVIKAIYEKPTTKIILNGEKLRTSPQRSKYVQSHH